jgi:tetratricopeptide (TPR) repeat protein
MSRKSARRKSRPSQPARLRTPRRVLLVGVALLLLVLAVFLPTAWDNFIYFDDDYYVTQNAVVQKGLTAGSISWALSTTDYFYWHPVTWLSHMLDCELYGLKPAGHHLTNVLIHAATTLLVFICFVYMTGALWRSAAVAALFAIHPLHVESVAWVAERKDVLAGFFWFAAVLAYAWYARRPAWNRYLLVAACFALGLMSKPVTVTLPFALLLLDYWPLNRLSTAKPARLLLEKVPLAALSAISSIVTYAGQKQMGAMERLAHVSFAVRIENAIVSYAAYLGKIVWPHPLALIYPYRTQIAPLAVAVSAVLLAAITAAAIILRARTAYLLSGWLWFAGVLVPMIGLVQVGSQSMADRFTYIPAVGVFVMLVWAAGQWLKPRAAAVVGAVVIAAFAVTASAQVRYWYDSLTLLRHTVAVTRDNSVAMHNLAFALAAEGRLAEAVPYYRESLRLEPRNPRGYYNLGLALAGLQKQDEAAACFQEAARLYPAYAEAHYSLGATLLQLNRLAPARDELEAALRLQLTTEYMAQAHFRLGVIAAYQSDLVRARAEFSDALRLKPGFPEAQANLDKAAALLEGSGRPPEH